VLTRRWVIYAPDRAHRPSEMERAEPAASELPEKDARCPFCIGNESMIPPILFELPADSSYGWQTRVVPNKYPALCPDVDVAGKNVGPHRTTTNYGRHEVVIETPFHNRDVPSMAPVEVESMIETYARRTSDLFCIDEAIEAVIVFRNHGRGAGTSLLHPHSQIVGTGLVPESVAHHEAAAAEYHRQNGRCVLCDVLEYERADGVRTIHENDSFLSWVPFAAQVPCEIWIVPKRHCAAFGSIAPRERTDLAAGLKHALQRLHEVLGDPDYNYVIRSASRQGAIAPYVHWFLQIRPRQTTPAGFEIGSGMEINPALPEEDAERLRDSR
jgi:UDPglucose--hexose-1-phosphate uridylyltransferase